MRSLGLLLVLAAILTISLVALWSSSHASATEALPCGSADPLADPDLDGISNGVESLLATDPCLMDSDGDMCMDGNEIVSKPVVGGDRDVLRRADFFDVTADARIDLNDTLAVLQRFGQASNTPELAKFDRYIPDPAKPYRAAFDTNGIDLNDALVSLASFGHDCSKSTLIPTCPEGMAGVKFDPLREATIGAITITDVIYAENEPVAFDWTSTIAISVVYVKGGTTYEAFTYGGAFDGSGLHAPDGKGISHALFCYEEGTPSPTPTATSSATVTATSTATRTATPTPTATVATPTHTASSTPSQTATSVPDTPTATPTASATRTTSPDPSPTNTSVATPTPTAGRHGLVKSVDGEIPSEGSDTILRNLWVCYDQATDLIDNDGDSTVDNEPATCTNNGEGVLIVDELVFAGPDCDTRNDDDDDDGKPTSNDPASPGYRAECPSPSSEDYLLGLVDKDGGELPEGLGAFEFQLKFDHKVFDISISSVNDWTNGRTIDCSITVITENDIRFGCTSLGPELGLFDLEGVRAAEITVLPEPDMRYRIRPTKDNGVVRRLLDENCEIADVIGDIYPGTFAGLTPDCTDIDLTVRKLEGDMDMDCDVDLIDARLMNERYQAFFGSLRYDAMYDLEPWPWGDYDIDVKDVQFVNGRVGSTCQNPLPDNQWPLPASGLGQP